MNSVIVTPRQQEVRVESGKLVILDRKGWETPLPLNAVSSLVLFEGVHAERKALQAMALAGIPVHFLTRSLRPAGTLWPHDSSHPWPRLVQMKASLNEEARHDLALKVAVWKIKGQRSSAARRLWGRQDESARLQLERLDRALKALEERPDIAAIRGWEGYASKASWSLFRLQLPTDWQMGVRSRPARDAVNSLLNLGSSLLAFEAEMVIRANGFDPAIGFLHVPKSAGSAFAYDLMEPFRPALAERWCLRLLGLKMVKPDDFERVEGSLVLTDSKKLTAACRAFRRQMEQPLPQGFPLKAQCGRTGLAVALSHLRERIYAWAGSPDLAQ